MFYYFYPQSNFVQILSLSHVAAIIVYKCAFTAVNLGLQAFLLKQPLLLITAPPPLSSFTSFAHSVGCIILTVFINISPNSERVFRKEENNINFLRPCSFYQFLVVCFLVFPFMSRRGKRNLKDSEYSLIFYPQIECFPRPFMSGLK